MENKGFNTLLIQQYLEGKLDPKQMHELEKEALDDPFLADAIEGYSYSHRSADHQLSILQRQLEERIVAQQHEKNVFNFSWQRLSIAAAAGLLFITAGILFWMRTQPPQQMANNPVKVELTPGLDKGGKPAPGQQPAAAQLETAKDSIALPLASAPVIARNTRAKRLSPVQHPAILADRQAKQSLAIAPPALDSEKVEIAKNAASSFEDFVVTQPAQAKEPVSPAAPLTLVAPAPGSEIQIRGTASQRVAGLAADATTSMEITGKIVSAEDGLPLPGVSVRLKGTDKAIATDASGQFKLPGSGTLSISYIGFESKEVKAEPGQPVVVQLKASSNALAEVAVIGYGTQKKSEMVGSVSVVSSDNAQPVLSQEKYEDYLQKNLRRPDGHALVSGKVQVEFTVGTNGSLSDFKIIRGLTDACNTEAIRLVKEGPAWKPAANGKPEKVRVTVSF